MAKEEKTEPVELNQGEDQGAVVFKKENQKSSFLKRFLFVVLILTLLVAVAAATILMLKILKATPTPAPFDIVQPSFEEDEVTIELEQQSSSDEISAIEADLGATDFSELDQELEEIEAELAAP